MNAQNVTVVVDDSHEESTNHSTPQHSDQDAQRQSNVVHLPEFHRIAQVVPRCNDLTEKQIEVLSLMAEGLSNKQIAGRMGVALGTVKTHVSQVLRRLNVERRGEAIVIAQRFNEIRAQQGERAQRGEGLLGLLIPHATHAQFKQGHVLFQRGEQANALYYIKRGTVAFAEVQDRVSEGEMFGEIGLFSKDRRRTATARCDTDVEAFVVTDEKARELYFLNPHFAMHVATTMAQRLSTKRAD